MIVISGTVSGFTPISTTGALIMARVAQQKNVEERFPQNKLFVELFTVSFLALFVLSVFAFIGDSPVAADPGVYQLVPLTVAIHLNGWQQLAPRFFTV